jgi:hypothetical protein
MKPEAIFAPVSVLALWTGFVLLLTGLRRVGAVVRGRVPARAFRLGESPEVPAELTLLNRNLMNLLEMPVLFYVVSIAFYVTRHADRAIIAMAWAYVALRLLHSAIHLTYNNVRHRLIAFALSTLVLLAMWIRFISRVVL